MALSSEQLDALAAAAGALYAAGAGTDAVVRSLKRQFAGVPVTGCRESDMAETPFREEPHFLLFLVDGRDHCWRITRDPEAARGIVIAERDGEDEP